MFYENGETPKKNNEVMAAAMEEVGREFCLEAKSVPKKKTKPDLKTS